MNLVAKQVTPQELHQLAMDYYRSLGTVGTKVEDYRDLANNSYAMSNLRKWIFNFIQKGILLAQAVLGTKEPPASQKKAFELAVRLFMSAGRGPNKGVAWFDKNLPLINLLYDAATQWPDKAEGEAKFTVGPFTVHNVIGLSGDELEGTKDALKKAALLLKGLSVPGIEKVLYGDVMLVAKLAKGTHVAWYYPNEDVVYIRPFKNAGSDELLSIIHELGHRYTHKFVDKTTWLHWRRYHANLAWQRTEVNTELPKVGDTLPFLLKGIKGKPVVQKIETIPPYPQPVYFFGPDKAIPERSLKRLMDEVASKRAKYPTAYSAKSDDEHFCEALSLRATGKLKDPHLEAFKTIIEDGQEYAVKLAHERVADRFLRRAADDSNWVEDNVLDKELVREIHALIDTLIREGRAVHKAFEDKLQWANKNVEGGDQVTRKQVLEAVRKVVEARWGDDAMAKPLTEMIAWGEYIW